MSAVYPSTDQCAFFLLGELIEFGEIVKDFIAGVRKYKSENNLSMRAEMDEAAVTCPQKYREWFLDSEKDFLACTHAKKIRYEFI